MFNNTFYKDFGLKHKDAYRNTPDRNTPDTICIMKMILYKTN